MEDQFHIESNGYGGKLLLKLDGMSKNRKHCDLVIKAEGKTINVHRNVICAASDYFDAMLSLDTKEKEEGVVDMKDVQFLAVTKCINFIYSGKIVLSEDECDGLLYCARLMQLVDLCDEISQFLEYRFSPKSFFRIKAIADKYSLVSLMKTCDAYALDEFFVLAMEDQFYELDVDYLSLLLSSKKSSVERAEDCKLAIALQRIKTDYGNRVNALMPLAKLLDISRITPGYKKYLVEKEAICKNFPKFNSYIKPPNFHSRLASLHSYTRERSAAATRVRRTKMTGPPDLKVIASAITRSNSFGILHDSSWQVTIYQPLQQKIIRMKELPDGFRTSIFGFCLKEQTLYVFSECRKTFRLNINQKNSTWSRLGDMLHDHGYFLQCTILEDYIYVGGNGKMERYKADGSESWENVDLDGNICNYSALAGTGGCVFVVGGEEQSKGVRSVEKYSPLVSEWKSMQPMNNARYKAAAMTFRRKIFVAGGLSAPNMKLSEFEMYDFELNSWTILTNMNSRRAGFELSAVNNQIFAAGYDERYELSIETYDLQKKEWSCHMNDLERDIPDWPPSQRQHAMTETSISFPLLSR